MKYTLFISLALVICACGTKNEQNKSKIKTEESIFSIGETNHKHFIAYDSTLNEKLPVVFIIPEWWGLNQYVKNRAQQLAELGYYAVVLDMYGEGKVAANPQEAQALASQFYGDVQKGNQIIRMSSLLVKTDSRVEVANMAIIGYCFGGAMALNAAKDGIDAKGIVSFHGSLKGSAPVKDKLRSEILICNGDADEFVDSAEIATFKHQMDSVGADYIFKSYPDATHAFTNPNATETGQKFNLPIRYNEKADKESWNDMKNFLARVFQKSA